MLAILPSQSTAKSQREATPLDDGQRLDRTLQRWHAKCPLKQMFHKWIRKGAVLLNGTRARHDQRLKTGDVVTFPTWTPFSPETSGSQRVNYAPPLRQIKSFLSGLLTRHEDDDLWILEKPAGVAVHGGSAHPWGVIEAVRSSRKEGVSLDLVHRIDRGTSGLLVLGKNPLATRLLHQSFRERRVSKLYHALVHGHTPQSFSVSDEIQTKGKRGLSFKEAETHFRVVQRFEGFTLIESKPNTGRMHQIRLHLAARGHPIVGDDLYETAALRRHTSRKVLLEMIPKRGFFLHASHLWFQHPLCEGQSIEVESPLPEGWQRAMERLLTQTSFE